MTPPFCFMILHNIIPLTSASFFRNQLHDLCLLMSVKIIQHTILPCNLSRRVGNNQIKVCARVLWQEIAFRHRCEIFFQFRFLVESKIIFHRYTPIQQRLRLVRRVFALSYT